MKLAAWGRSFLIGAVVALSSELYWNLVDNRFRISLAVVVFAVFLILFSRKMQFYQLCLAVPLSVYLCRAGLGFLLARAGDDYTAYLVSILPNALFYLSFYLIFGRMTNWRYTASARTLVLAFFVGDLVSNCLELLSHAAIDSSVPELEQMTKLLMVALVRTMLFAAILIGIRSFQLLLKKEEHESRYRRLFLLKTDLRSELFYMHKNTEEIERIMTMAYRLYEAAETPSFKETALSIARDVHEVKKDYLRVMQGIEQEIADSYNRADMHLSDLMKLLETSAYLKIDEKHLNIRLLINCRSDFKTDQYYALMSVLRNLVNNSIEALEDKQEQGVISIEEWKEGETYRFQIQDNGRGISPRNLNYIFRFGFSTKFNQKTGDLARGVGLSGVKYTVEQVFHGSISIYSREGGGCTAELSLPADTLEAGRISNGGT